MKLNTARAGLVTLALAGSLLAPATAAKAADGCVPGIGTKTPIVFVHGFNEKAEAWDSFEKKLNSKLRVWTYRFDYEKFNTRWVTDPNIGARLARQIACMATSSRNEGGAGKVGVVVHSMGGNATHQAFKEDPSIKNDVGLVATIGTPNTGSDFDRDLTNAVFKACGAQLVLPLGIVCATNTIAFLNAVKAVPALATGSKEMRELPGWPSTVPVYAIAGNMRPTISFLQLAGIATRPGEPSGTDGIVRVNSALHGVKANGLGGTFEYVCVSPGQAWIGVKADCEHNAMLRSTTVQNKVVEALKAAIKLYKPKPTIPVVACPTATQIDTAVTDHLSDQGVPVVSSSSGEVQCAEGWAVTSIVTKIEGGGETFGGVALRKQGSSWQVIDLGSEFTGGPACEQAPARVRTWMGC